MIPDWKKRGPVYEVPFRTLYSSKVKNLICVGRCTSVTETMWDIMRLIPCCAVTGQAAGTAAAMTEDFSALDVTMLQAKLQKDGIRIHEKKLSKIDWRKTMIMKRICLILALLMLTLLFAGCCISAKEPTYTAYGTMYINNNAMQADTSSMNSTQCVPTSVLSSHETYIQIGNSNKLRNVIEEQFPNEPYTYAFESLDDTGIIKVSVTSNDPETSAKICNAILDVYPKIIADIIEGSSCKVIDRATVPTQPDKFTFFG